MKISRRARSAMYLMLEVARRPGAPTSLREVSERTRVSRRSLDQLAISLRNASLLRGQSGHRGGYRLTRPPARIAVREIIEAAVGPLSIAECVGRPEVCLESGLCECRVVYALVNQRILELLDGISLAEIADTSWLRRAKGELARYARAREEAQGLAGARAWPTRACPARDISSQNGRGPANSGSAG